MPFYPGDPNINRNGRPPKSTALTDMLRDYADKTVKVQGEDGKERRIKRKNILTNKLWELALDGDKEAMKYIYDRLEGKPQQYKETDLNIKEMPIPDIVIKKYSTKKEEKEE
jgi:hypothetical protein